jgi:hypothetical protein
MTKCPNCAVDLEFDGYGLICRDCNQYWGEEE